MSRPAQVPGGAVADGCAEARATVEARCGEAHQAAVAHESAVERVRELRRDLVAAQHRLHEATLADDAQVRAAEKTAAHDAYQLARATAKDDEAARQAMVTWAKALDHINRSARLRHREVTRAKAAVETLESALRPAQREEQAARLRASQTEAACLDARVALAACEERPQDPGDAPPADVAEPGAVTGSHAVAIPEVPVGGPLVIESMVSGDRETLELAAARIAEHTGRSPAEEQLGLQELVDAVISAAADDGFLRFDQGHRFWSGLSFEESHDVVGALARLGFVYEPEEGWHAGRAPAPSDLSMALAYAGLDARNMRGLPTADELRSLPASIEVDARSFLAARAPDLIIDHLVRALGQRARTLEQLWNEWGQVRPILLEDRRALGPVRE